MADHSTTPMDNESGVYLYSRKSWKNAGIDNFTQPPAQDEDLLEIATNVLPPITNNFLRRFGYAAFTPSLDTGISSGQDQLPQQALFGVVFDGASGYMSTAKSYTFNKNPVLSVEFWFETISTSGGYFVSLEPNTIITGGEQQYLGIYMNTTGNIGIGYFNGTSVQLSATSPLAYNDGFGHMVDAVFNGTTLTLYVDGAQVVQTTVTAGAGTVGTFWRLGQGSGGTGWPAFTFMKAFMSHVSIFGTTALSAAQVTNHYNALTSVTGTVTNYETVVAADSPTYFWYLNEQPTTNVGAPIAQSAKNHWDNTGNGTCNFTQPVTAGNAILVVLGQNSTPVPSISDTGGNVYTLLQHIPNSGGFSIYIWLATGVSGSGSNIISITAGSSGAHSSIVALEIRNVTGSPLDSSSTPTTQFGGSFNTPAVTTAFAQDLILSCVYSPSIATPTTANGFAPAVVNSYTLSNGFQFTAGISQVIKTSTGSYSGSWTKTQSSNRVLSSTVAIELSAITNPPNSNIANDYADTNPGTYQSPGEFTLGTFIVVL